MRLARPATNGTCQFVPGEGRVSLTTASDVARSRAPGAGAGPGWLLSTAFVWTGLWPRRVEAHRASGHGIAWSLCLTREGHRGPCGRCDDRYGADGWRLGPGVHAHLGPLGSTFVSSVRAFALCRRASTLPPAPSRRRGSTSDGGQVVEADASLHLGRDEGSAT